MTETLPRRAVLLAVLLVGVLVAAVVVLSQVLGDPGDATEPLPRTGPVALVPVEAPDASSPSCGTLLDALPGELPSGTESLRVAEIAVPAPVGARAWGPSDKPVVLRCGLARPPELTPTSALRDVSGVRWLPIEGELSTTFFAVDRPVFVAVTVPLGSGTGVLQVISETVARVLPAQPVAP